MSLFVPKVIQQAESLCCEIANVTPAPKTWRQEQRLRYLKRQISVLTRSASIEDKKLLAHLEGLIDSLADRFPKNSRSINQTETHEEAVKRGFNPGDYTFDPLPDGEWVGILDAKIWGKANRFTTLRCYFTTPQGDRYSVSAFRARDNSNTRHWYTAQDAKLNLKDPSVELGQAFLIVTGTNSRGNPFWKSVQPLCSKTPQTALS
ncbi:hypothetical protein ACQ4M3_20425 [Leptolyngbya sp. AN03gr2]|uniref:hypothetical protein n=1 Tax=unclassified Leptolyngbya TaxID=2650499 RepID=UPI003D31794A